MLVRLSIRDVVLIDRLDVSFASGLSVLTGETGSGKSILLDSLGLALGVRADSSLVRQGASQLNVTVHFDPLPDHPVWTILAEYDIGARTDEGEGLVLRRTVTADGRSRAYLNDQLVSVALLRRIGSALVEVHGQFESHGLLDPLTHRGVLDSFASLDTTTVIEAWQTWQTQARTYAAAKADFKKVCTEEDLLRHAVAELDALAPSPDEEAELAACRSALMRGEKIFTALNAASTTLRQGGGVEGTLRLAQRQLEKVAVHADGRLETVITTIERAIIEVGEALSILEQVAAAIALDPRHLEKVEERLFTLRAAARKHSIAVEELACLHDVLRVKLAVLEEGGSTVANLARVEQAARATYLTAARSLSQARTEAARRLDTAITSELEPLKLEQALFHTQVVPLPETEWSANGLDQVVFTVATNPGTSSAPLHRIVSGGELARFMLALKVVLVRTSPICTMVFDEVDTGVGGATAYAVGECLARLAADVQVLVVTHSPQVAARGDHHFKIEKLSAFPAMSDSSPFAVLEEQATLMTAANLVSPTMRTVVEPLILAARREEIARMLAGAAITDQARAAADSLMAGIVSP